MIKNQYSAQRRRIHAFAIALAKAKLGPGPHRPQAIGVMAHPISDYAINWHSMVKCRLASILHGLHARCRGAAARCPEERWTSRHFIALPHREKGSGRLRASVRGTISR